jgi:hypothetical protein
VTFDGCGQSLAGCPPVRPIIHGLISGAAVVVARAVRVTRRRRCCSVPTSPMTSSGFRGGCWDRLPGSSYSARWRSCAITLRCRQLSWRREPLGAFPSCAAFSHALTSMVARGQRSKYGMPPGVSGPRGHEVSSLRIDIRNQAVCGARRRSFATSAWKARAAPVRPRSHFSQLRRFPSRCRLVFVEIAAVVRLSCRLSAFRRSVRRVRRHDGMGAFPIVGPFSDGLTGLVAQTSRSKYEKPPVRTAAFVEVDRRQ